MCYHHSGRTRDRFRADFGRDHVRGAYVRWGGDFRRVQADIEETEGQFLITVYAAGLQKELIRVFVKDDVLQITYSVHEPSGTYHRIYTHREFFNRSFERRFVLNGKVIVDAIVAVYADGILKITLPKNPATNKPAQEINVG